MEVHTLFLRDGRRFIWLSERTGYRHIYLYDWTAAIALRSRAENGRCLNFRLWMKGTPWSISSAQKDPQHNGRLYRVAFDGSGLQRVTREVGWHEISFAPDSTAYIDRYSAATTQPREDVNTAEGNRIHAVRHGWSRLRYSSAPSC